MAITTIRSSRSSIATLEFDGTSTSVEVDFHAQIVADTLTTQKTPLSIAQVNGNGNPAATLSGTKVTFTWAVAQPAGAANVTVYLLFPSA